MNLVDGFKVAAHEHNAQPTLSEVKLQRRCVLPTEKGDVKFHSNGGTAWVLLAEFHDGGLSLRPKHTVLKISHPRAERADSDRVAGEFRREITILTVLQHPNIVKYLASGECHVNADDDQKRRKSFYCFMEREAGVPVGSLAAQKPKMDFAKLCFAMESALDALIHMADRFVAHLDIHPNNILVDCASGRCVVIDFGKAVFAGTEYMRNSAVGVDEASFVGKVAGAYSVAEEWTHPELRAHIQKCEKSDPTLAAAEFREGFKALLSASGFERFDLYALGKTLESLADGVMLDDEHEYAPLLAALRLVLASLVEKNRGAEAGFGAAEARDAIAQVRSSIQDGNIRLIRLSGGANVRIRSKFATVVDTPQFQRLRGIAQLSLTSLVYPSATHTRFSHSLGAFDLAGRYLSALARNSSRCRVGISPGIRDCVQMKALVHDIGHYPFAHYFEEMMETEGGQGPVRYATGARRLDFHHETLGTALLEGKVDVPRDWRAHQRLLLEQVSAVTEKIESHPLHRVLKGITDGPLDCDKVDYLARDGMACGVPYASSIDVERLLAALTIGKEPEPPTTTSRWSMRPKNPPPRPFVLMINEKGIAPAESILAARYQMFSEVYWHKVARGIAAMLKQAMAIAVSSRAINQRQFWRHAVGSDDVRFLLWLKDAVAENACEPMAADALVTSLLGHRRIYKRAFSLSAGWEHTPDSLYHETLEAVTADHGRRRETSFAKVQYLQGKLRLRLERRLSVPIPTWAFLLDVPPGHSKDEKYPFVLYEKFPSDPRRLSDASGLLTRGATDLGSTRLLATSHRIRVYVEPEVLENMTRAAKAIKEFEGRLDNVISIELGEELTSRQPAGSAKIRPRQHTDLGS